MAHHAKLSASQTKRWMNCPGSVALVDALPGGARRGSNKYSREGTAAHALLSACIAAAEEHGYQHERYHPVSQANGKVEVCVHPDEMGGDGWVRQVGVKLENPDPPGCTVFPVDKEMADAVQVAFDEVVRLKELHPWGKVRIDQRADLDAFGEDLGGHSDIVFDAWPDALYVIDYKHGAGVTVEVEENEQCRSYLLGESHRDGYTHAVYYTGIVQPRKPHPDGPVRYEQIDPAAIREWGEKLRAARLAVDAPDAPLNVGEWCKFCDASGRCPKQREVAENAAQADFADEPPPGEMVLPESIEELAQLLRWEAPVKALFKSARARVTEAAMRGDPIPGMKLVLGKQGNREWVGTPEEIALELAKETGVEPGTYYEPPELRSPAQVEKLGAKHKKALERIAATRIYRAPGKPTLVGEGHKGAAIEASALASFPAYDGEDDDAEG